MGIELPLMNIPYHSPLGITPLGYPLLFSPACPWTSRVSFVIYSNLLCVQMWMVCTNPVLRMFMFSRPSLCYWFSNLTTVRYRICTLVHIIRILGSVTCPPLRCMYKYLGVAGRSCTLPLCTMYRYGTRTICDSLNSTQLLMHFYSLFLQFRFPWE